MLSLAGTYQNGNIKLDKEYSSEKPVKVIVTFLDDVKEPVEKRLTLADFSFMESQKALAHYKGSFSDTVIDERRSEL
jgi:hypothetical protein